jgi:hypothetical protein
MIYEQDELFDTHCRLLGNVTQIGQEVGVLGMTKRAFDFRTFGREFGLGWGYVIF